VSKLITPENLSFYRANKAQIDPIATWTNDR